MNTTETIIRCIIATVLIASAVVIFLLPTFYTKHNESVIQSPRSQVNVEDDDFISKGAVRLSDADMSFINQCKQKGFQGCTINGTYISFQ